MAKDRQKRLSENDRRALWGEDGPYSEIYLSEQTRLLDDGISRVFLVVEAKINPFTFEYVMRNRDAFADDLNLQDLLDHAEYRERDGYVVCAGEEELIDQQSVALAKRYKQALIEQVLKMHTFVIEAFGLKKAVSARTEGITVRDTSSFFEPNKYIWDDSEGVVPADEYALDSDMLIPSTAGTKNGKLRYFIVLALVSPKKALAEEEVRFLMLHLIDLSAKFKIDIEDISGNMGYVLVTAYIDPDTVPVEFIETFIDKANSYKKGAVFHKDHFVTNIARPSFGDIEGFLRKLRKKKE